MAIKSTQNIKSTEEQHKHALEISDFVADEIMKELHEIYLSNK